MESEGNSKLTAMMGRQASEENNELAGYDEVTVHTFEEVIDDDEEAVEEENDGGEDDEVDDDPEVGLDELSDVASEEEKEDEEEDEEGEIDEEAEEPHIEKSDHSDIDGETELERNASQISFDEFEKDNPNVARVTENQNPRSRPMQQQSLATAENFDDQPLRDGYDGHQGEKYSANQEFGRASPYKYGNDQLPQRTRSYDEDAAFGRGQFSKPGYLDEPRQRFEDEEQAYLSSPPIGYDPRLSKARSVDSFDENRLRFILCASCCCLVSTFTGVLLVLLLWILRDENAQTREATLNPNLTPIPSSSPTISNAPTVSPAPSIPPVPTAAQPVTARLSQTEQSSEPGLGTSLAMSGDYMVLGDPNVGNGQVLTFSRSGSSTDFTPVAVAVSNSVTTELFGAAIDMVTRSNGDLAMLVGATRTRGTVNVQSQDVINIYGSAHYFTYDGSSWVEVGGPIRGSLAFEETGGLFGQAVAMASDVQRVVVSAPSSSSDRDNLNTGKIYTFRYDGQSWDRTASVLQGPAESYAGTSLAMSNDGSRLLIGAPGSGTSDGQFSYHEWTGSDWETVIVQTGPSSSSFGTSLAFLDRGAANSFVVGGPTANSGEGVVIAYIQSTSNPTKFVRFGDPIYGAPGEGIGKILCGKNDLIAFGTNDGTMKLYQFNGGDWSQVGSVSTGTTTPTDCSISDDISRISVGTGERVRVYELLTDEG